MENWIKIHLKHLSDERSECDLGDLLVQPAAGGPHHVLVTRAQNTSVNHNLRGPRQLCDRRDLTFQMI